MGYNQDQYKNTKDQVIRDGLNRWALYFRRKINEEMVTIYRKYMVPYSTKTIRAIVEQLIEGGDRFPKVYEVKTYLAAAETLDDTVVYNQDEDLRFPVGKMWQGYKILIRQGQDAFIRYADSVRMPKGDRERIALKANAAFGDTPSVMGRITNLAALMSTNEHERGFYTHPEHHKEIER